MLTKILGRLAGLIACACMASLFVVMPAIADETITYRYDELGRLIVVDRFGTANNGAQSAYAFDKAGNRLGAATGASGTGSDPAVAQLCAMDLPPEVKAQLGCP